MTTKTTLRSQLESLLLLADEGALLALLAEEVALDPTDLKMIDDIVQGDDALRQGYRLDGDVARIPIQGPIVKSVPNWAKFYGLRVAGVRDIAFAHKNAEADTRVREIMLDVDSPGGVMSGLFGLHDQLKAGKKPLSATIDGMGASAAYLLAATANRIVATKGSSVGSIGVFAIIPDFSKMMTDAGIKVHRVASAPLKGAGAFGTEITPEQLAYFQSRVDQAAAMFKAEVQADRKLSLEQVDKAATGETWFAQDALALGLIDAIETNADATSAITSAPSNTVAQNGEREEMGDENKILQALNALGDRIEKLEKKPVPEGKADATLAAIIEGQKEAVITKGQNEGKIVPANLAVVKELAASMELAELREYIDKMPKLTHEDPSSLADDQTLGEKMTAKDKKIFQAFGLGMEDVKQYGTAESFCMSTRTMKLEDGRQFEVKADFSPERIEANMPGFSTLKPHRLARLCGHGVDAQLEEVK